jgi:hypothetical protein
MTLARTARCAYVSRYVAPARKDISMLGLMMSSPHRRKLAVLFGAILALGIGVALFTGTLG